MASTLLTYPAAAAVVCTVGLLVALALDLRSPLYRVAVCLTLAGPSLPAVTGTCWPWPAGPCSSPARRWSLAVWPLGCGAVAGMATVAASTGSGPHGWTWPVVLVVVAASMAPLGDRERSGWGRAAAVAGLVVGSGLIVATLFLPSGGGRVPGGQGQTLAWSSASEAWRSSVVTGVGPPRTSTVRGPVAVYPGLEPDSYLTILADGGVVGGLLLLVGGSAVASGVRRRDVLIVRGRGGLRGLRRRRLRRLRLAAPARWPSWAAASSPWRRRHREGRDPRSPKRASRYRPGPASSPRPGWQWWSPWWPPSWSVGSGGRSGATSPAPVREPLPTTHPESPGQTILTGPDPTDPFMVKTGGRYLPLHERGDQLPQRAAVDRHPARTVAHAGGRAAHPSGLGAGRAAPGRPTCTG